MIILYLFTYFSIIVFVILIIVKIFKYANMPVHLRWELYPVAHEPERNKYGGSYYEETNWWKKKIKKNHFSELWVMIEEIFFLKGVFIHNKKLWLCSFPFHLGLYLIVGTFGFIVISVLLDLTAIVSMNNMHTIFGRFIHYLTDVVGYVGLALTGMGCIGLIVQRTTEKKFKFYNTPMDFINLYFILILIISVTLSLIYSNSSFTASKEYVKNLFTLNFAGIDDFSFIFHIVLICLFLLYFPITRMMHLFAKYFTYHNVRWDDESNVKGGKLEKRIKEALNFGVSWSAPHMRTGKTWAEVATTLPPEVKK